MKEKRAPQPLKFARTILTASHQVKIAEKPVRLLICRNLFDPAKVDARDRRSGVPAELRLGCAQCPLVPCRWLCWDADAARRRVSPEQPCHVR